MNVTKTIFIASVLLFSMVRSFAQVKDSSFGTTDPVKSVQVYPNPASEFLNIKFEAPVAKKSIFKIHNIIGNEILVDTEVIDDYEVRLKVKDLHEGYYIIALQNTQSGVKSTLKFLKL
jgi:Secretion system C-terminal sorting domain